MRSLRILLALVVLRTAVATVGYEIEVTAAQEAATQILKLEKDEWSRAYQLALIVLLEDRVRAIASADSARQRETFAHVKTFLAAKREKAVTVEDAALAMSTARALEYAGNRQLAVEAYRNFGGQICSSGQEEARKTVIMMRGAARRLTLLDRELKITGRTTDGAPFDWEPYRGQVVLVLFWASWCGPCRAELSHVRKNYARYHEQGFNVVGISVDSDRKALERYLELEQLPWVTLHVAEGGSRGDMAEPYGVMDLPTPFLVDREGKVVSLHAHGTELDRLLEELIGPP
jgi:peroxiredoxin